MLRQQVLELDLPGLDSGLLDFDFVGELEPLVVLDGEVRDQLVSVGGPLNRRPVWDDAVCS